MPRVTAARHGDAAAATFRSVTSRVSLINPNNTDEIILSSALENDGGRLYIVRRRREVEARRHQGDEPAEQTRLVDGV